MTTRISPLILVPILLLGPPVGAAFAGDKPKAKPSKDAKVKPAAPKAREPKSIMQRSQAMSWVGVLGLTFTRTLVNAKNSAGVNSLMSAELATDLKTYPGFMEIRRAMVAKLGYEEKIKVKIASVSLSPLGYQAFIRVDVASEKGAFHGTIHCNDGAEGWRVSFFSFGEFKPAQATEPKARRAGPQLPGERVEEVKPHGKSPEETKDDKPAKDQAKGQ